MNKTWQIVLGSPGTGKTTHALRLVSEQLRQKLPPADIGYLAFTTKAANVARGRAVRDLKLHARDLMYFRTIHSLCFRLLSLRPQDIMTYRHYREIGADLGLELSGERLNPDLYEDTTPIGDKMFALVNKARDTLKPLEDVFNESNITEISYEQTHKVSEALKAYKSRFGLYDYNDMLELACKYNRYPALKMLIVDEAQDLSALQWRVIRQLGKEVEIKYAVGDDDQAIFKWAGASPEIFTSLSEDITVLKQSYRLPYPIYKVGLSITDKIQKRLDKPFSPNGNDGVVNNVVNIEDIDMSTGNWMLLVRNRYQLKILNDICEQYGYSYSSALDIYGKNSVIQAVCDWNSLYRGGALSATQVKNIRKFCRFEFRPYRDSLYNLNSLALKWKPWQEMFVNINESLKGYINTAESLGEDLAKPRIHINTIHGAKGEECDNIVLMTDMSLKTYDGLQENPDDEHRVFYVGATRAKQALHIVEAKSPQSYDMPHSRRLL